MSNNTPEPPGHPPPPGLTADAGSWLADYQARRGRERRDARARARDLAGRLGQLGVARAAAHYDGCGDSGQVESVEFYAGDGAGAAAVAVPGELAAALESVCELLCPDGYENNDGGSGDLTLEVPQRRLVLEHADRYTRSTSETISAAVPPLDRAADAGVPGDAYPALDWLAEHGVRAVTIAYDGYADDGTIEDTDYEPAPAVCVPRWVEDALQGLACHFLPGGWEIDEGGHGELALDVRARTVAIEHNGRYQDAEAHTTAWDLNTLQVADDDPGEGDDAEG